MNWKGFPINIKNSETFKKKCCIFSSKKTSQGEQKQQQQQQTIKRSQKTKENWMFNQLKTECGYFNGFRKDYGKL